MPVRARPPYERALEKISKLDGPDGCWIWTASTDAHGYGRIGVKVEPGKTALLSAHRLMYETTVGPIPDGLQLDHLCRTRACVNPSHLEPVTHAENMRRGRLARTACRNGHENPTRDAWGDCVLCRQARERRRVRRRPTTTPSLEGITR